VELKLNSQNLGASDAAKAAAIAVLSRARNRPNFGNGGEVENLLSKAKMQYQLRQKSIPVQDRTGDIVFEPQDFDPQFDRSANASENISTLFAGLIGFEKTIAKLQSFARVTAALRARGEDPRTEIPTNFVFKGPPGMRLTFSVA
jgi:hypothetical protein